MEELADRRGQVARRRQALEEQQAQQVRLRQERAQAQAVLADLTAFCARIRGRIAEASFADKQAILQLLVERIVVYDDHLEVRHVIPLRDPGQPARPPSPEPANGGLRGSCSLSLILGRPCILASRGLSRP